MTQALHDRAARALELIRQGAPAASAARSAGVPVRAVQACALAAPGDAQGVLETLARLAMEVERRERQLRGAASWPFVLLLAALLSSAVVWSVAMPALRSAPMGGAQVSLVPAVLALGASSLLLVALGLAVLLRVPVPGLTRAWASIDRHAFASCTHLLHAAGVPLTGALRAAASWLPPRGRAAGEGVARALEAGGTEAPTAAAVLEEAALGLLWSAAKSGTAAPMLGALHATTRVTMEREVPRELTRLHTTALLLAGLAVGVSFGTFYLTYIRAVTG